MMPSIRTVWGAGTMRMFWEWVASWVRATQPQRADFESLVSLFRQRISDMDAEFQAYRSYTTARIVELQAEAEECRAQREKDALTIDRLKTEVRHLRDEVAELRKGA